MNSTATLAVVLALAALFVVASRRLDRWRTAMLVLFMTALSLTYVRSAMIGLVGGLLGLLWATRGRASARVAILLMATAMPVIALSAVSPTGQAIVDRVTTLGSAGEATNLRDSGGLRVTDNGYLALMWQLGPAGFLLVVGAAAMAVGALARARLRTAEHLELKGLVMAGLVLLLVLALGGDVFYGAAGAFFWYLIGKALWLADHAPALRPVQVPPRMPRHPVA